MHLLKLIIFSVFTFGLVFPCWSQVIIKGTVTDSLQNPIPNVNIYATSLDSTSIKAFDYTNRMGEFSLKLKLHQAYFLHVSSLGYKKKIIAIPTRPSPDTLVKKIVLQTENIELKELVVEEKRPAIIAKKDTIIFIAESFLRGNEESVEDILKQLPGITVGSDGRIKANGKTITKVFIENDDLFGFNYQLLTKNFTAKAIETVSVYDHYQENTALKGVSESDKTVLNLGLKEEFKVDFFGTVTGYYDLDENYQLDGNLVSITQNFKGYLFESANNIGHNPVGNVYQLLQNVDSFPFQSSTTLGTNTGSTSFISTSSHRVSQLDQEQYLDNKTTFHGAAGIYNISEDFKIKGVGYFLPANRRINQRAVTQYDSALGLQDLVQQEITTKNIDAGLAKITATYEPSKQTNLQYEGEFNTFPETDRTNLIFRNEPLQTRLKTNEKVWNQQLRFTRKVAEGKAYRMRVRHKNVSTQQNFHINPALSGGGFVSGTAALVVQQSQSDGSYIGTDVTYWSRKPNNLFSVQLGAERSGNNLANRIDGQPDFSNQQFWNRYQSFSTISYRQTLFSGLEVNGDLTGNYIHNSTNLHADVDDDLFYLSYEVSLQYEFAVKQEIQLWYSFNQDLPDFNTLFGARRLTSYRSIEEGSNNFILLPSNIFSASYRYGNWEDNFVANAFFNYFTSDKNYTTANTVTNTYNFGIYRLQRDWQSYITRLEVDQFINFLQSNLAVQYNFSSSTFTSFFNNSANDIRSNSHFFSSFIRTAFVGAFNASAGVDYNFSSSRNQDNNFRSTYEYTSGFLNINLDIGEKFSTNAEFNYYQIKNAGNYSFLNTSVRYKFIEDKLTLYLNATNILEETSFQTISTGSFTKNQTRDTLNPRYILIGAKVSFR